jgi:hypothetical protein
MLSLGLGACSSIVEGTSQEILVSTNPSEASCDLIREETVIAHIVKTPASTTIKKTKHDMRIECSKEGFHKAVYYNKSDVAGATVGNIILGGGVGWAIDSASGADNKYTSPVNITLVPLTQPAPPPQYSTPPEEEKKEPTS